MTYWRFNYLLEKEKARLNKKELTKEEFDRLVKKVKEQMAEEEEEERENDF